MEEHIKDYKDLVYNAHMTLKDYYSYEQISCMPMRVILGELDFMRPKIKEIMRAQANATLQAELSGQRHQVRPGGIR